MVVLSRLLSVELVLHLDGASLDVVIVQDLGVP